MKLNVVTHSPGKAREYQLALEGYGVSVAHVSREYDEPQTLYLEEVVDKGMTQLYAEGLRDFMVDDSGLFIETLGGFPGVYSAYVQRTIGNDGILKLMEGTNDRRAVFKCCIGCWIGDEKIVVTGKCPGLIMHEAMGTEGFGYDPIFTPDGERSFAEIRAEEKNVISHRGLAVAMLVDELKGHGLI